MAVSSQTGFIIIHKSVEEFYKGIGSFHVKTPCHNLTPSEMNVVIVR
jgi:hypothetical protein